MAWSGQLGVFLLLAAAASAQDDTTPPPESEQKEILAKITANALQYSRNLPDFVCNRITRRNVDSSGTGQRWRPTETINEELTYTGHKEEYKVLTVNGKKAANAERAEGEVPASEFGDLLTWIFDPSAHTEFKWNSSATLSKRPVYVIAYKVERGRSQLSLTGGKMRVTVAFAGLVWADRETGMVVRVLANCQSPAKFPLQNGTFEVNYAPAKIDEREFLLPLNSDFRAKAGKRLMWTEAEFRGYRKPGA